MTTEGMVTAPARRHAVFHPLRVAAVERLTDDAVAVTFDVPEELRADYAFAPGQHLTIRTEIDGEAVRRNYSICATPSSGRLRVAVKRLQGGAFSSFANTGLRPRDVVEVMTPTGRFGSVLTTGGDRDAQPARSYCAIAAGSGITPVLSIVATVLETEPASQVTLVYGNRSTADVMFLEELEDLKDLHPTRLRLVHVLSREPQEVELFSGRIDGARVSRMLATILPPDTVDEWFLCGPFGMVEQVRDALLEHGVALSNVHTELFHAEGEAPRETAGPVDDPAASGQSAVTVLLDGRATTFPLGRSGQRILDAVLAVRADAPYACKGGVCGTCRAKLVEGEVLMDRNYALEQDELDAGTVLACQSHPTSDTVVLDFDA